MYAPLVGELVRAPQKGSTESASTPSRGSMFAGVLSKIFLGLDTCLLEGFVYMMIWLLSNGL